jgi:hypothetical protein
MRLDIQSTPRMNGGTMEQLKSLMPVIAVFWPLLVCIMLAFCVAFRRQTDWKVASCLSGLSIATSLLLLLASEKLLFLRYQDAVLQVNQKTEQVSKLTEQNKRIAKATAQAIAHGLAGAIMDAGYDPKVLESYLEDMLKEAGVSRSEIDEILGRSAPAYKP